MCVGVCSRASEIAESVFISVCVCLFVCFFSVFYFSILAETKPLYRKLNGCALPYVFGSFSPVLLSLCIIYLLRFSYHGGRYRKTEDTVCAEKHSIQRWLFFSLPTSLRGVGKKKKKLVSLLRHSLRRDHSLVLCVCLCVSLSFSLCTGSLFLFCTFVLLCSLYSAGCDS